MPDQTPPSTPSPGYAPAHPQPHHTHESDPPTAITIRENRTLYQRIAEEETKYAGGFPVAGHGEGRGR